ncbi:hypothetical protein Klosneuvirus_9_7 [Klosneuvirus KNV1]|uniref:Uncharacterized protein n=1 Tax=Klosneuvirus KNV1 TaxID=1977640 RepID=A0A1V0SLJ1_9VIRU|nr:hypothetical protein Klosneuvirus_9_7 [Klosneuvirus KNV1]
MNSIININSCDLAMITLFFIIIFAFGIYKYMHNEKPYNDLDKQVDEILNRTDTIIKQQIKTEIPKNLDVDDYRIPEFLINSDSASALEHETKSRL